jgi:hypothetical protein
MTERIIKGTALAWLNSSQGPDTLKDDPSSVVSAVCIYNPVDEDRERGIKSWQAMGYTLIGEADVTLRIHADEKSLIASKVDSLKAEKDKIAAEAQARMTEIERKINTLLAIEYTPAGAGDAA